MMLKYVSYWSAYTDRSVDRVYISSGRTQTPQQIDKVK